MVVALCSSSALRVLPRISTYTYNPLPSLKPNLRQCHLPERRMIIQLMMRRKSTLKPLCAGKSNRSKHPSSRLLPRSPPEAVDDYYLSLNEKDLDRFHEIIAEECIFEDLAFSKPFEGQKVHDFLNDLTKAMGKDVKFIVDDIYEDSESKTAVLWHLEWKDKRIPFATGCSFFDFLKVEEGFQIKKSIVYFESPLKPGEFVLELLKFVTLLFDNFPNQAKWFLNKPQMVIHFIMKMYKMWVKPFILPLIVYYTHMWTFAARILSFFLNLVQTLLKFFM